MAALSAEARSRLKDLVELEPTKNKELQDRWGLDSGSEVHAYLEAELGEYYYRDDDSLIRATPAAAELVGGESGPVTVSPLQSRILEVLGGPDEDPISVVATLHRVRAAGPDPGVDAVRSALRGLVDRGVVETVHRTVPTYRLAAPLTDLWVTTAEDTEDPSTDQDSDDRTDPTPTRRGG